MTKKRILVIDDEQDFLTYISTVLEDAGYEVVKAEDGEKGLAEVNNQRPDLITLDITMPNKTGVRFYRDIKENDALKGIPIIIITGVTQDFKQFISSRRQVPPPEGYISKPVEPVELVKTVEKLLAGG